MKYIIISILTLLVSCEKRNSKDHNLKNNFDFCAKSSEKIELTVHQLTEMEFRIPRDWKVRRNAKLNGIECIDTTFAKRESKIRIFSAYEFDSLTTNLKEYLDSQIKLIEKSSMTFLEKGTKLIGGKDSYYIVASDTVNNFPVYQVYFYTDYLNKRYTTVIGTSITNNPIDDICKSMWIIDGITFKAE